LKNYVKEQVFFIAKNFNLQDDTSNFTASSYHNDATGTKSVMKTSGSEMTQLAANVGRVGKLHKLPHHMIIGKVGPCA
jgi:hypothetical protein